MRKTTLCLWIAIAGCAGGQGTSGTRHGDGGPPLGDAEATLGDDASLAPTEVVDPEPIATCAGTAGSLARPGESGDRELVLSSGGLLRRVLLHVPESYDPSTPSMLVLDFHGFTSAEWQEALLDGLSGRADERNFVVAYPQGVASSWNAGTCCGTAWVDAVDDVQFVRDLLDRLEAEYCIDAARVFATGMSNGGFLSHRLACELSDRIAAIAPVAGVIGVDRETCDPGRPVPVLHFHGTEDPLVPYTGGTPGPMPGIATPIAFPSVAETMEHWRVHNGCEDATRITYQVGDSTCVEWVGCEAPTRVCTVRGGGHTWPGGLPVPFLGYTTEDLDASSMMLDFFASTPMP